MAEIEIIDVESNGGRRAFIEFPHKLYRGDRCWVPPLRSAESLMLDPQRHPFYKHAELRMFLARRDGEDVGRVAAILDSSLPPDSGRVVGSFGFFECLDDQPAAQALTGAAKSWLHSKGARLVRGPANPSTNYPSGLLVDGFGDPPCLGMTYNPRYYPDLLSASGFTAAHELLAFTIQLEELRGAKARRLLRFGNTLAGLRVRPVDLSKLESEAEWIWKIYSSGWAANWGFAPISKEEVQHIARELKTIADPRFLQFCEIDGQPVGVFVALPDWNQALIRARGRLFPFGWWHLFRGKKRINRARIFIVGVSLDWKGSAMAAAFLGLAEHQAADQYLSLEASWIVESNHAAVRAIETLGGRVYKRYRIVESPIS